MSSGQRSLRLFQFYVFFNRLDMWHPVIVLFLLERGFSLTQYAIVDAVWYLSTVLFEVPTGIVTDRYGKRLSLFMALVGQAAALFLLVFGRSFALLLLSYALWGFASSFESGTTDAFVYDTLAEMGREERYRRIRGRIMALMILAAALGSVGAGYLGELNLALPIFATGVIACLLLPLVLFLREPQVSIARAPSHWLHLREAAQFLKEDPFVVLLILYPAVMETAIWALYMFYQPLLRSFGISIRGIGYAYLGFTLCRAVAAHLADRFYERTGVVAIYLLPAAFAAAVLGLGLASDPWVIGLIVVIYTVAGLYAPILNGLLNERLPSNKRATIVSVGSAFNCALGALAYPLLAALADATALQTAILALSGTAAASMAVILARLRRHLGHENNAGTAQPSGASP